MLSLCFKLKKEQDEQLALIEISYDNNIILSSESMLSKRYLVGGVELPYTG